MDTEQKPAEDLATRIAEQTGGKVVPIHGGESGAFEKMSLSDLTHNSLARVLQALGIRIRKNVLSQEIEWRPAESEDNADWIEFDSTEDAIFWQRTYSLLKGKSSKTSLTHSEKKGLLETYIRDNQLEVNPFRDWLDLVGTDISGVEDPYRNLNPIRQLWETPMPRGAREEDWEAYIDKLGWLPFVAAVANAYSEEVPNFRVAPVLVGAQELGKSTWLTASLPRRQQGRWDSTAEFYSSLKEFVPQLAGKVFVEIAEGVGLSSKQREKVKSFLGRKVVSYRRNYDNHTTAFERRWFIYFSTNEAQPIPFDPSGYSRYAVVRLAEPRGKPQKDYQLAVCSDAADLLEEEVGGSYPELREPANWGVFVYCWMTLNRKRVWAYAQHLYETHGQSFLQFNEAESRAQRVAAGGAVKKSELDDRLEHALTNHPDGSGNVAALTLLDLSRAVGLTTMSDRLPKEEHFLKRNLLTAGYEQATGQRINVEWIDAINDVEPGRDREWRRTKAPVWYHPELCSLDNCANLARDYKSSVRTELASEETDEPISGHYLSHDTDQW